MPRHSQDRRRNVQEKNFLENSDDGSTSEEEEEYDSQEDRVQKRQAAQRQTRAARKRAREQAMGADSSEERSGQLRRFQGLERTHL